MATTNAGTTRAASLLATASSRQTWRALGALARPHRWVGIGAGAALFAGTASGLLAPPILGHIVDLVVDGRGPGSVTVPVLLLVAAAVLQAVLSGAGEILVARFGEAVLATLREKVVDRALRLPLSDVERAGSGDLVSRVSGDVSVIAGAIRTALPALAGAGLTIGLTLAGLVALDWRFAVAALLAAPVQLYALRWYLRRSAPVYRAERVKEGARTQQLLDSIGGADTVHAFGLTDRHLTAVRDRSGDALECALEANRIATRFYGRLNLAELIGMLAVLGAGYLMVGGRLPGGGAVTVGTAAAAALYFHRVFDPVNELLGLFDTAQAAAAGLARLVGVAQVPATSDPVAPHAPASASVRVRSAGFAYDEGRRVLHAVDMEIPAGLHVALVGASGAGKSTLAKLVAGVHRPDDGSVALGGVDLADIAPADLRRHVALVTQEVHVFAGPLADDLRLARPTASDAELRQALELVGARGWVEALPDGLSTVVGQGGHRLTATRAQQLALARLVLADPAVAVLDEATADAGSAGARVLERAVTTALHGRAALVVAHRLSQAAAADLVVVMDDGRVVEAGTHADLLRDHGGYARLWAAWSTGRVPG